MAVYAIVGEALSRVKIGYSKSTTANGRLLTMQTGSPDNLSVLAVAPHRPRSVERTLHAVYSKHNVHGEWFDEAVLREIREAPDFEAWIDAALKRYNPRIHKPRRSPKQRRQARRSWSTRKKTTKPVIVPPVLDLLKQPFPLTASRLRLLGPLRVQGRGVVVGDKMFVAGEVFPWEELETITLRDVKELLLGSRLDLSPGSLPRLWF